MSFAVGAIAGGIVPLLRHSKQITGSYFRPTYSSGDTRASLNVIWKNLGYYWQAEKITWIVPLLILSIALAALVVLVRFSTRTPGKNWWRWMRARAGFILAPVSAVVIAGAFFLTHVVTEGYYLIPSFMTAGAIITVLFFDLEQEWRRQPMLISPSVMAITPAIAIATAAVALAVNADRILEAARSLRQPAPDAPIVFDLPAEMRDKRAWIWADDFSGSVRRYASHPAFKIVSSSQPVRRKIYEWIGARGDPQYMIQDSEGMLHMRDEARTFGWTTTLVGHVRGRPCYRMAPASSPP